MGGGRAQIKLEGGGVAISRQFSVLSKRRIDLVCLELLGRIPERNHWASALSGKYFANVAKRTGGANPAPTTGYEQRILQSYFWEGILEG